MVDEAAHAGVFFEVRVNESLGFFLLNAKLLGQSKRRESIDDAEIDDFGVAAVVGRNHQRRHAKDLRRSQSVDVLASPERFHQQLVFGKMRQQAQLDLRIVCRKQQIAFLGDERRADLASQLGADGNVLQIRIHR